jgi:hypothetical protein
LAANGLNKYQITGVFGKEVIINIQITSGDLKVELNDFDTVSITKQNAKGSTNLHIVVPTKDLANKQPPVPSFANSFGLSNFTHLHLSVQSQN